ncbi:hypothetical protein JXA47_06720 [Candidatus Sumerlaeota bacterium]|nr:hypothetical protein [Candidatus Sumerlaeota bacterium]
MSPTLTLHRHPHQPGPATLRAEVGEGGLLTLIPGVLGVNLLPGLAAPRGLTPEGHEVQPLHARPGEAAGDDAWLWEIQSGPVQGTWRMTFAPDGLLLDFALRLEQRLGTLTPLAIPIRADAGWLVLPGADPIDLSDRREASECFTIGDGPQAWSLSSQGGLALVAREGNRPFDSVRLDRLSETLWRVSLCHDGLTAGEKIEGQVILRALPFNGCTDVTRITEACLAPPVSVAFPEPPTPTLIDSALEDDGSLALRLGGQTLRVTASECGKPLREKMVDEITLTAAETALSGQRVWRVDLRMTTARPMRGLRLDAELDTPCGNPTWEGDATVLIPGNMARCNFHPDHIHGGGPKWGPSPIPTEEPNVQNAEAPGCCHGWTFAGSRLPQVWSAAVDRAAKRMVWIGTAPRSDLGENCAGFVSPEGRTTTLRLATPTTYEPWVPLGYSRMRKMPRRDTAAVPKGETITWTLWVAAEETEDLNAWAALDRALYLHCRPAEPTPLKLTLDGAAKICAGAIHDRFFKTDLDRIVYSTGPEGQAANLAFTGMAHSALVMLWAGHEFGEERWRAAGTRVLDTVARMFLEGPGFPWTSLSAVGRGGEVEGSSAGSGEPGYVTMVGFDNLAEALRRERSWGRDHPAWEQALRRCAEHWLKSQSPEGAFPHWGPDFGPNFGANEYGITNIEAGVIANMIDAHDLFGGEEYLESARRAAALCGRHLDDGRLWGGPGDIRALVNSEVPMFMLRGFRRLFERTQDPEHRRLMLAAAAWRHSFQYAHSWPVEVGSSLWRQGWAGLGMESASASNLHAVAFGGINLPDEWALWKITGDEYQRLRCEDLARYMVQQFARFPGDLGFPFAGAGTESWWVSDTVWGKGYPWIFTDPGFDLGFMSWVTGWSGYGALWARELGIQI